ncbi:MAG: dihydrolipoyl dehydrogenase [Firmicutes bacterium]|nr:dihydrolipoyl dehydrogenase [Bacillota bacterium]
MTQSKPEYDLLILGAGPGGYVAALLASKKGLKVGVIEADKLGGTCLNRGCIPTKALVAVAERYRGLEDAGTMGIRVENYSLDPEAVWAFQEGVTARLRKGVESLFRKHGVDLISGRGRLTGPLSVSVTGPEGEVVEYTASDVIIATGSLPRVFPGWEVDGQTVVTSDEVLGLRSIPKDLVIIGGGYIGCEFASIFAALGSKVTILEGMPEILPMVDKDLTNRLKSYLKRQGITIKTGVMVERVWAQDGQGLVKTKEEDYAGSKVLISVGRVPNSKGIGLEEAGVEVTEGGEIVVDSAMRTNLPHVYAIGDVTTSPYKLAHVASKQAEVALANILGENKTMDYSAVPSAIFTSPEVATVGLTEEQAAEDGLNPVTGSFMFTANGKALSINDNRGLVKIVATPEGKTVGVHILGPHASDLLPEAVLAVQKGLSVKEWAEVIRAHPTLAETTLEALEAVFGTPVHG